MLTLNRLLSTLSSTATLALLLTCAPPIQAQETTIDSLSVPEGFVIERVADSSLTAYPMFMTFDDEGRLLIAESTGKDLSGQEMVDAPECQILRLEDTDGDGVYDTRTVFAESLSLPMGILWHQGSLFVASPPEFLRFDDTDGDGKADHREVLLKGWNIFNTASLHGPFLGPDGRLYLTHGRHGYDIQTKEGTNLKGTAARIWRCWPDGTELERFAGGGFDNPVEILFTDAGEMLGTMTYFTNPMFGQRDALMHWTWGGVYPKGGEVIAEFIRTGPDLMPVMSKFSRIAPAGLERYRGTAFGKDYTNSLFSAQFNPHRIQRHTLIREGATYRTEDSDFLTCSNPDFYPTDALEDADGSLLVSDTGAWYVDACPISRVAKPEVKGAIYRIRKTDAKTVADPWGKAIAWDTLSTKDLVELLSDTRLRVNDRALAALVLQDTKATKLLGQALSKSRNDHTRLLALTALRQVKDPASVRHIRTALDDPSQDVRMAAAQALGDLKDVAAIDKLIRLLHSGTSPEQRAAAEALGHIGNPKATAQLLMAAAKPMDRFTEHAVIYALIEIADQSLVHAQLEGAKASPVGKAALIVLDQLKYPKLNAAHVIPFLDSPEPALRKTGLWVASHHTEWAPEVLAYVEQSLRAPSFSRTESDGTTEVLLSYIGSGQCQALIATLLTEATSSDELRLFLLDVIANTRQSSFSESWNAGIQASIDSKNTDIRWAALELIGTRSLATFDASLLAMTANEAESERFRLAALAALTTRTPQLSAAQLQLLLSNLNRADDPTLRQSAARLLAAITLSSEDKLVLANDYLPNADALVLGSILNVFEGESAEDLGTAIVAALLQNKTFADVINPGLLKASLAAFPESIQLQAIPLHALLAKGNEDLLKRFTTLEKQLGTGDVGRGRRIFFGEVAACSTCHAIGADGGTLGPDLTTIGEVRTGHDLLEAVLFPNSSFVPEFTPYMVETKEDLYVGLIGRETSEGITLKTGVGAERYISRDSIIDMTTSALSIMPEGLDAGLTDQEVLDMITFLQSLNGNNFLEPAK